MKAKRIAIAFTCIAVVTFITFIALSSRQAVVNWKLQHQPTPTGAAYELPIEVTKRNFGTSRWSLVTTLNERTSAYFQFLVEDDSGERVDSLKTQAHNPNSSKKSFRKTFYMERLPVGKYKVRLIIKDDAQVADFSNKPKYHLRINAETGSQGSFWLIIALVLFWLPVLYYAIRRDIHHNLAAHR